MRALAEFIMRGRMQACLVALLGSFFPFVSPATIGLVTLTKGSTEGTLVALWALLPLIVGYFISGATPFLTIVSGLALVNMVVVANVLRQTVAWSTTLSGAVIAGALFAGVSGVLFGDDLASIVLEIDTVFEKMSQQLDQSMAAPSGTMMLAISSWMIALSTIAGLFVSRWWQAILYNPGGFQQEFHGIRLDSKLGLALAVLMGAGVLLPDDYRIWVQVASIPLLVAGLALVHCWVKVKAKGIQWLVFVYLGLIVYSPIIMALLVLVGLADSFMNLRTRLASDTHR